MFKTYIFFEQMASDLLDAQIKGKSLKPILEKYLLKQNNILKENFDEIINAAEQKIRGELQHLIAKFPPATHYKEIATRIARMLKKTYADKINPKADTTQNKTSTDEASPKEDVPVSKMPWQDIVTKYKGKKEELTEKTKEKIKSLGGINKALQNLHHISWLAILQAKYKIEDLISFEQAKELLNNPTVKEKLVGQYANVKNTLEYLAGRNTTFSTIEPKTAARMLSMTEKELEELAEKGKIKRNEYGEYYFDSMKEYKKKLASGSDATSKPASTSSGGSSGTEKPAPAKEIKNEPPEEVEKSEKDDISYNDDFTDLLQDAEKTAKELGISEEELEKLVNKGLLKRDKSGYYSVESIEKYKQNLNSGSSGGGTEKSAPAKEIKNLSPEAKEKTEKFIKDIKLSNKNKSEIGEINEKNVVEYFKNKLTKEYSNDVKQISLDDLTTMIALQDKFDVNFFNKKQLGDLHTNVNIGKNYEVLDLIQKLYEKEPAKVAESTRFDFSNPKNIGTFRNFLVTEEKTNSKFKNLFNEVIKSKLNTESKTKILLNHFINEANNIDPEQRYQMAFGMKNEKNMTNIMKGIFTLFKKELNSNIGKIKNQKEKDVAKQIIGQIEKLETSVADPKNSINLIKKLVKPEQLVHKSDKPVSSFGRMLGYETPFEKLARKKFFKELQEYMNMTELNLASIQRNTTGDAKALQTTLENALQKLKNKNAVPSLQKWVQINQQYFTKEGLKKLAAGMAAEQKAAAGKTWNGSNTAKVAGTVTAGVVAAIMIASIFSGGNVASKAANIKSAANDAKATATYVLSGTTPTTTPDNVTVEPDTSTPSTGEPEAPKSSAEPEQQKDTDQKPTGEPEQSKKFTQDDIKKYYEKGAEFAKKTGEGFAKFVKTAEDLKKQNDANKENQEKDDAKDVGEGLTKGDLKKMSFYEIEKKFKDNKDVLKNMIQQKIDAEGGFDWVAQDQTKLGNISNIQTDNDISIISAEKANELLKNPKFQGEYNQEKLKNIIKQATKE